MKVFGRIIALLFFVAAGVVFFMLDPATHQIFPECVFHSVTGYYCPGCGSQRAIHNLVHLNLARTIHNNLLFIPAGLLVGYHYSYSYVNKKLNLNLPNLFYYKVTPWIILAVIVLFGILRNLPFFPFTGLAP